MGAKGRITRYAIWRLHKGDTCVEGADLLPEYTHGARRIPCQRTGSARRLRAAKGDLEGDAEETV